MKFSIDRLLSVLFFLIAATILGIAVIVVGSYLNLAAQHARNAASIVIPLVPPAYRLLDGIVVSPIQSELRPLAVMVENHADARPVAGLEDARIVYESVVEGEITRFLAIFDGGAEVDRIGPVRSVRPFFLQLAAEWDPVLFHAGGSPEALQLLRGVMLDAVNEISGDGIYFWRDPQRQTPHNLYTSADLMRRAALAKDFDPKAGFASWRFDDFVLRDRNQRQGLENQQPVVIRLSADSAYLVVYRYEPASNSYVRYVNDQIDKTERGIILKTDNLVVQYVDSQIIDSYGRLNVDVQTGGRADIYRNGELVLANWQVVDGRTRFFDAQNREVAFRRGTVWIELVFNNS